MVVIGILGTGAQCIGRLKPDGSLEDVYMMMLQPAPQGAAGVACALVSPFQPFESEKGLKSVAASFIMGTRPAPKELEKVYTQRVSDIIIAQPMDVAMVNDKNKEKKLKL